MIKLKTCTFPVIFLMLSLPCSLVVVDAQSQRMSYEEIPSRDLDTHSIRYRNGRLSVQVNNVSMQELLDDIAAHCGLTVVGEVDSDQRLTMVFHKINLDAVLERILGHRRFILLAGTQKQTPAFAAVHEILWLFPQANEQDTSSKISDSDQEANSDSFDGTNLGDANPGEQVNTVSELENNEDSKALSQLALMLADENADVRLEAASVLAIVGGNQAVESLTTAALGDEDSSVRKEAVHALGEIGGDSVIHIVEYALMDPDDEVRAAAINAYADIGGEKSVMVLATALNDADPNLRAKVVDALGEIGGEAAIGFLRHALLDEDSSIREAAAEYLDDLSSQ